MSTATSPQRLLAHEEHQDALEKGVSLLLQHQQAEGYWWYTLEANESIAAGMIQIMHFVGEVDETAQKGLIQRMISEQNADGSWSIFYGGPSDLSTTIECYFAMRLAGRSPEEEPLQRARKFILSRGGLTKMRVFSRIHLALFGLAPWSSCPTMPVWFMLLPPRLGVSIYEFSSWARASIVPLLLVDAVKPVRPIDFSLDELYVEPAGERVFRFPKPQKTWSLENFFIQFDKVLKLLERFPWHPGKKLAMRKAEQWTRDHVARTEDIYPAMGYAIIALKGMGFSNSDPTIKKALNGLKNFRQRYQSESLPERPNDCAPSPSESVHQQCCISPNWDTPWAGVALIEAGVDPSHPQLQKAARYLISKEIKDFRGDWAVKNPKGPTGGWAFEFQNDYFPDVDDAIEAIHFLKKVGLPEEEKAGPIQRGFDWIVSMQSDNGGWAAFDKNNVSDWVNKIPFSDHGACLDPPTPDITGRMLETFALLGHSKNHSAVKHALSFLHRTQESFGAWRGRWGVNYLYGTWCVLQGLAAIGEDRNSPSFRKAVQWLESVQLKDGGWGESCLSDEQNQFVPLPESTASQTAWAVMALLAAGERDSIAVHRGIKWLIDHQQEDGGWQELHFTGTGFPGHFYIRYHGYRYYFPVLALAKYQFRQR